MLRVNGIDVKIDVFPNNEGIFKSEVGQNLHSMFEFEFRFDTDMDLVKLQVYKHFVADKYPNAPTNLLMWYVPYSRMDREIPGYVFSLKYISKMINALNFDNVTIFDPHSSVTPALLDRCETIYPTFLVNQTLNEEADMLGEEIDYIFYPDAGAFKKYTEVLEVDLPSFSGTKVRDLNTGKILYYRLLDVPDNLEDKNVLIVDDLCSKGYTFFLASTALRQAGAKNVSLYISHCENSIFKGELLKPRNKHLINRIYTTPSLLTDWNNHKLIKVGGF